MTTSSQDTSIHTNTTKSTVFPVVLACDSKYVPYMAVCLFSIAMNARTPNVLYKIYLLHTDFTHANIHFLQRTIHSTNNPNVELAFIKIDNFKQERFHQNGSYISVSTYYRLLIPMIFTNYDKILYLDGDIVVTADVFKLNEVDLGDNLTAGSYDTYINRCVYEDVHRQEIQTYNMNMDCFDDAYAYGHLKIKPGYTDHYFNAGVLVFNLKRFRELNIESIYFQTLLTLKNPIYMDQDIINYINMQYCEPEKMVFIDRCYNRLIYNTAWYEYHQTPANAIDTVDLIFNHFEEYVRNYLPYRLNDSIFHFLGPTKPWNIPSGLCYGVWWACVLAMPNAQEYKDRYGYCEELDFIFRYFKETIFTYPRKTNDQLDFSKFQPQKVITLNDVEVNNYNDKKFAFLFSGVAL